MSPRRNAPVVVWAVTLAGVAGLAPFAAQAQCNYPFLGSGGAGYFPFGTNYYPTVVQPTTYWSAVAVRPDAGSDWDLRAYSTAVLFPNCVAGELASSVHGSSTVDLVVGDFNHTPTGTFYVHPYHFSGGGGAMVEWDNGADQLLIKGPRLERSTGPNDVIEVWDVFLEAGKNYSFDLQSGGSCQMTMLLYQNPANASYWSNRSGAAMMYQQPPNTSTIGGIEVNQTDWYGLIMVNENGGSGVYRLLIETCPAAPSLLSSDAGVFATEPGWHYAINQTHTTFASVGLRGNDGFTYWTLDLGENPNGQSPWCYATQRASASDVAKAAYVVGDFNPGANATGGIHNVRVRSPFGTTGQTCAVEWDGGPDSIVVNAPPIAGTTHSSDVVTSWDVALQAGYRYQVEFTHAGAANLKLALFDNPGGLYWVPRGSASAESNATFYFDAPRTDTYGLVLANDNGQDGTYSIAVNRCALTDIVSENATFVAVPPGDNGHFEIQAVAPSWAAVMLLSTTGAQDWTLDLFADNLGAPPACFSNLRATSALPPGRADVIAGRPNLAGSGAEFFARARPEFGTSVNALFQWEQGTQSLVVDAPPLTLPAGAGHYVQCWDVALTGGIPYQFTLTKTAGPDMRLMLFRPDDLLHDGLWKRRDQAEFDVTGNTNYVAPVSGTYGVVAIDDNGATGSYQVGVNTLSPVAVEPGALPVETRLERIVPHPVTHDGRIHYALARAGDVSFEIVNAAGRRVAEIKEGAREPGLWSAAWSGRGSNGSALASGVYFVRMRVDGVRVADARLVQLP